MSDSREGTPPLVPPKPTPTRNPSGRPQTSGTELNLRASRQKAATHFQRAARAEKAYRAKRRASFARKDWQASKEHFRDAKTSFRMGAQCLWASVTAVPAVMKAKNEERKESVQKREMEKAEGKKKKWEEKVRKSEGGASDDAPLTEGQGARAAEEPATAVV